MKRLLPLLLALALLCSLGGCAGNKTELDPDDPVTLTMWHVYGEQADSPMNRLVDEFNRTVGLEKGVVIDVTVMSNGSQIGGKLLDAQAGKPGAPAMPDLFFCHTNNAEALGAEQLVDWQELFTEEELSAYVEEFVEEGRSGERLVVFPVSKSTHLLFLNGTRFDRFSAETGVREADLADWEGFLEAAGAYYDWSGGKPFCAMDYLLRAVELSLLSRGGEVRMKDGWYDPEDEAFHGAWLPFARALVQGHIVVSDLYANTQVMTGETAAGLGSSAAILYYNDVVTYPDNTTEDMDLRVLPQPQTRGGRPMITQAGVGLCALRSEDGRRTAAASLFAHWLTEPQRNLEFVAETGYMPVNRGAFEAMDGYEFRDKSFERLYRTLRETAGTGTAVTEPGMGGYYERVHTFYDRLREQAPRLNERYRAGEAPELLAEETWELLKNVR